MSRGAGRVTARLKEFFEANPERTVHTFEAAAMVFHSESERMSGNPIELSAAEIVSTRRALQWLRRNGLAYPIGHNRQGRRVWAGREQAIRSAGRELNAFGSRAAASMDAELLAALAQDDG